MDRRLQLMLNRYSLREGQDYVNALKEIIQEIALLGLWRSKFFEKAAFCGGTALRILHGLDRFSEDLDFSLQSPNPSFTLDKYNQAIADELISFGLEVTVENKLKNIDTTIQSAFIKAGTKAQLLHIGVPSDIVKPVHRDQNMKIKMEVDIDPPGNFQTESREIYQPITFSVRSHELPDLFAGKLHACLCRQWRTRIKGRDWYDLIWYIVQGTPVRLQQLSSCLQQSGHIDSTSKLTKELLLSMLTNKIEQLDVNLAKADIEPYINDPAALESWSREFFLQLAEKLKVV